MADEHDMAVRDTGRLGEGSVPQHQRARDVGRVLRGFLAGLLVAVLVALGVDNRREVRVGWVVGDGDASLWIIVLVAAVIGAMIGWLVTHRPHRH